MTNMLMIIIAMNLIFMKHPLTMGMIIIIQTILISMKSGLLSFNFWLSYILFLIMIGGLLILFIYMTSIASNEKFMFSNKIFYFNFILLLFMLIQIMMDKFLNLNLLYNINMKMFNESYNFNFMINKYININSNFIYLMSIIYLLMTLIVCVKITSTFKGPMRQMN